MDKMFNDIKGFYPTPVNLVNKMLEKVDFRTISSVLEPSAGKGNIVDRVVEKFKYSHSYGYNKETKWDIDCVEIDENLQYILQGKGYRIVHNDYLTYNTYKKYDLIIMNPDFASGDKHLLKAISMQENGGKIVCILNAETLKNPCTNTRKDLLNKLELYNADIQYINNAFWDAERKTHVEIALIKIDILKNENNSIILNELKKEEQHRAEPEQINNTLINADFIKGIIEQYNYEVKAGLKLIAEYKALKPLFVNSFKENNIYSNSILDLTLHYEDKTTTLENGYIKQVRSKYWQALFTNDQFMGLFTSNLRQKYYNQVGELCHYDFSLYNIYTIKIQINNEMIKAVEETILNLFEEFSHKHSWYDETSSNIHYYNGWKTNKAWKINKKVIIPLNGFNWYHKDKLDYDYKIKDKLTDIEKVFNYLDDGQTENIDIQQSLKMAEHYGETKKIELKYFLITFYKKGTCHIEFTNDALLHKFNLYGAQRKGWLPPTYGKVKYKDMSQEEKDVINEFEGEISYNKVMNNKDYYIVEPSKLLLMA
jgi:hypothetical protein